MRYNVVKNANKIIDSSSYLIKNPESYKGKWKDVFSNNNPICLELGMGRGSFIIEMAKKHPNINYIGIEKSASILAIATKRLERLDNLYLINYDALKLDEVFSNEISKIYLNFSDPWPKVRHHFRRLTSNIFLDKYDDIFKNTKEIYLRTDNEYLYTYSIETLSNHNYALNDVTFDLHKTEENLITTEYEDRFSSRNQPIYSLKAIDKNV